MTLALVRFEEGAKEKMNRFMQEHDFHLVKSTSMKSLKNRLSKFRSNRKLSESHLKPPRKELDIPEAQYAVEKGWLKEEQVKPDLWKKISTTEGEN